MRIGRVAALSSSATLTVVKRRASASSSAIVVRYSSGVVAPMTAMSPRASAGFSASPALTPPSLRPRLASRWISSRNRMIPGWLASATTWAIRSSNWPRYCVPALSEASGSSTIRAPRSGEGTLPATIRWARPSTIAVLPTPAGPSRTGLRLALRTRISIIQAVSSSRPIVGRRSPSAASFVRSRPSWSRSGVGRGPAAVAPGAAPSVASATAGGAGGVSTRCGAVVCPAGRAAAAAGRRATSAVRRDASASWSMPRWSQSKARSSPVWSESDALDAGRTAARGGRPSARPRSVDPLALGRRVGFLRGRHRASVPNPSIGEPCVSLARTRSMYACDLSISVESAVTVFCIVSSAATLNVSISSIVA